ncbi:MAG: DUF2809 domain-containing protein [Dysgonomonas sp.]
MKSIESKSTLRFDWKSFLIFLFLFIVEVLIALFVDDAIIRPYVGDVLVIPLMYYFIKAFVKTKSIYIIIGVLLFAYVVEVSQYFKLVEVLGWQNNTALRIILGSSFTWFDILAYTLGAGLCYLLDRNR